MTLSNLILTAKFEFVIISRHLVVKKGSQKSSVPKEFIEKKTRAVQSGLVAGSPQTTILCFYLFFHIKDIYLLFQNIYFYKNPTKNY